MLSIRPILTPKSVLPLFFIVGIVFAPIGGVLLWANSQVCLRIWGSALWSDLATQSVSAVDQTLIDLSLALD